MTMLARTRSIPEALGPRGARSRVIGLTGGGDGSTLDVDFTTGSLPSGWSFVRSGNGLYVNASGGLSSAGTNVPRFAFDPTTLQPLGVLMEGQRINYLCHSQTFLTSTGTNQWADSADFLRYTSDNTAPDGTATALQASCDVANATCINSLSRTPNANAIGGTFSIWLRRVSGSGSIQLTDNNGTNWTTVAVTSTWTRFQLPHRTTAQQCGVRIVTGGDAIQMWGAQLEDGSGASSYIATTTGQATRTKDALSLTSLAAMGGFTPTAGTLFVDMAFVSEQGAGYSSGSGYPSFAQFAQATVGGYRMRFIYNNAWLTTPRLLHIGHNASDAQIGTALTVGSRTALARVKAAFAWSGSGTVTRTISTNGATGISGADGTGPVGSADRLLFNQSGANGDDDFPCYTLRRLKYFPRALTQAELNALTA